VVPAALRSRDTRPTEDAGVLLLLVLMGGCVALVLQELVVARPPVLPVTGAAAVTGWLVSGRRLRRWWWMPIAAFVGAAAAIWLGGAALWPGASPLEQSLRMREALLSDPWHIHDAATAGGKVAGPMALVAVVWTGPLLAARAFRLRRPAAHVWVPMAVLLLAGMGISETRQLGPLMVYAAGSLLLSVTVATAASRRRWHRRGMTETDGVTGAMVRRGWIATAATVTLAWALTTVAVGAPLEAAWRQVGEWWGDRSSGIVIGQASFGRDFQISEVFNPTRQVVAQVSGIGAQTYLRAVTHDTYTGAGWTQSRGPTHRTEPGDPLLPDMSLELSAAGSLGDPVEVEVRLERGGSELLLPGQTHSISIASAATQSDRGPFLVALAPASALAAGESYTVLATIRHASGSHLAGAGAPDASAFAAYLSLENVSAATRAEAVRVTAGQSTAYARATALVDYLRGAPFRYATRTQKPDAESGPDAVDFFLFDESGGRVGFCEQFASAMVVMARSVGIPARLARGYAGGEPVGRFTYRFRGAQGHAWAELYFPGFGWQVFEATPSVQRVIRQGGQAPVGAPTTSVAPLPSAGSAAPTRRPQTDVGGPGSEGNLPPLALLAAAAILAGTASGIALAVVRRRRRVAIGRAGGPPAAARLWGRLARGAALAGIGPRPNQTAYEFAGALAQAVPDLGPEVHLLASAYVVEMYAAPGNAPSRTGELWAAWRRVAAALRRHRLSRLVRGIRRA